MSETVPTAVPAREPSRERDDVETPRERVAYLAYRGLERVAMALPEPVGRAAFTGLAAAAFRLAAGVRSVVADNLAQVLGRPAGSPLVKAATREAFALYARYWHETFLARAFSPDEVNRRFRMIDREHIDRALEAGRGCIVALPHMGNWDAAGQFMAVNGYRLISVAEELRPRRLAELFLRHREALGMEIIVLEDAKSVGLRLSSLLARNCVVALVADRDLGGRGVDVEMFGAVRKLPPGPALLALSTGAALLPAAVWTEDDGWLCRIGSPLHVERTDSLREDVTALTRMLGAEFERAIAARPVDWHMFQPAWPEDRHRPQERSLLVPG